MKQTIRSNLRQVFYSAAFFLATMGTVLTLFIGSFESLWTAIQSLRQGLLAYGFHDELLQTAVQSEAFLLALPILCALPFTASYLDDLKSGFIKEYLPRTRLSHYIIGKLTACILSGGGCLVLGVLIFYGCSALILLPLESALEEGAEAANWLEPLLKDCILVFCSGGFWSLTGMTMAALTRSKYMAYASPFIFYYVLVILCERYFKKIYVFYPKEWMNPAEWTGGVWGVVLLLAELSALLILIFSITAQRRLRNL